MIEILLGTLIIILLLLIKIQSGRIDKMIEGQTIFYTEYTNYLNSMTKYVEAVDGALWSLNVRIEALHKQCEGEQDEV